MIIGIKESIEGRIKYKKSKNIIVISSFDEWEPYHPIEIASLRIATALNKSKNNLLLGDVMCRTGSPMCGRQSQNGV